MILNSLIYAKLCEKYYFAGNVIGKVMKSQEENRRGFIGDNHKKALLLEVKARL